MGGENDFSKIENFEFRQHQLLTCFSVRRGRYTKSFLEQTRERRWTFETNTLANNADLFSGS